MEHSVLYISFVLVAILSFATIYFFLKWQKAEGKIVAQVKIASDIEVRERLAIQSYENIKTQMDDWEKAKKEHLEATKSSMLEVISQLSNKLLTDHKRESETANKEAEERVKKTTEDLQNKFQTVFEKMKSLNDKVDESGKVVDVFNRSLLSPQGAGQLAEITLGNVLKNSGLVEGIDYELQYSVVGEDGDRFRPDAIIYLPQGNILVIDCKSSKFFIDDESNPENDSNLKQTLNRHLTSLTNKEYSKAVEQSVSAKERVSKIGKVYTFMFLPSDAASEKIRRVDPGFFDKAQQNFITVSGPAGLINLLFQTKFLIEKDKQEQNYIQIIDEVKSLIDSIIKLYSETSNIGKGLSDTLQKYNKLSDNFNRIVFKKLKKINALGLNTNSSKDVKTLPKYEFFKSEETTELPDLKVINND